MYPCWSARGLFAASDHTFLSVYCFVAFFCLCLVLFLGAEALPESNAGFDFVHLAFAIQEDPWKSWGPWGGFLGGHFGCSGVRRGRRGWPFRAPWNPEKYTPKLSPGFFKSGERNFEILTTRLGHRWGIWDWAWRGDGSMGCAWEPVGVPWSSQKYFEMLSPSRQDSLLRR